MTLSASGQSPEHRTKYAYDSAGNLNWRTNDALQQNFGVNSLNELTTISRQGNMTVAGGVSTTPTSVTVKDNANAAQAATVYGDNTFTREGVTLLDGTNTFTAVAQDSLGRTDTSTSVAYLPASVSHSYDLDGNLLNDGRRYFSYDDENQLVAVIVTNGPGSSTRSDFVYDGKMRRRLRFESTWAGGAWVTNTIVAYVYDGNLVIQERWFTPQVSTTIPQQVVSYTRGVDLSGTIEGAGGIGGLLARSDSLASIASGGGGSPALYHCDGNGNVTCLISTNQIVVAKYLYDPYGNILSQVGPLAEANLYRFSSKEVHLNSGLVYYLYRSYDPGLQRWLSRDPSADTAHFAFRGAGAAPARTFLTEYVQRAPVFEFESGPNLFQFVRNSALENIDPDGLDCLNDLTSCATATIAAAAACKNYASNPKTCWVAVVNAANACTKASKECAKCFPGGPDPTIPPVRPPPWGLH